MKLVTMIATIAFAAAAFAAPATTTTAPGTKVAQTTPPSAPTATKDAAPANNTDAKPGPKKSGASTSKGHKKAAAKPTN